MLIRIEFVHDSCAATTVGLGLAVKADIRNDVSPPIFRDFGIKLLKFIFYTCLAVAGAAVILIPYIRRFLQNRR